MRIPVTAVPTSRLTRLGLPACGEGQPRRVRELSSDERAALGITCSLDDLRALLDDAHYLAAREDATYWNEDDQEIDPDDYAHAAHHPSMTATRWEHSSGQ